MNSVLHVSRIDDLLETKKPLDIIFRKKSTGEMVTAKGVFVTSIYGSENTCNILFPNGEIRTIRKILIFQINNTKIYL